MPQRALLRTQELTIIAQDPSVRINGNILTTQVSIPAEELAPGPRGYRVQVVDYDSTTGELFPPLEYRILENGAYNDPFKSESNKVLLEDPQFHAQNVYAIIMRTLSRFESAVGGNDDGAIFLCSVFLDFFRHPHHQIGGSIFGPTSAAKIDQDVPEILFVVESQHEAITKTDLIATKC